jgi:hypothetical protein
MHGLFVKLVAKSKRMSFSLKFKEMFQKRNAQKKKKKKKR